MTVQRPVCREPSSRLQAPQGAAGHLQAAIIVCITILLHYLLHVFVPKFVSHVPDPSHMIKAETIASTLIAQLPHPRCEIFRSDKFALLWGEAQLCLPYVCL